MLDISVVVAMGGPGSCLIVGVVALYDPAQMWQLRPQKPLIGIGTYIWAALKHGPLGYAMQCVM